MMVDEKMGISNEEAIDGLMEFGLSKEEAEIYLLLIENQSMTVRELNQQTPNIQRTYLYNFLDKLATNGWVHIDTLTKPQSYNPYHMDLEEKLKEKEQEIKKYQKDFTIFKEKTFPQLKNYIDSLYEKSALQKITTPYKDYFKDFFKGRKIRVDYSTYQAQGNPFLSLLLIGMEFHGFHIFHHEKPISEEHVIHFYMFSDNEILSNTENVIGRLLEWRKQEIIKLFTKQDIKIEEAKGEKSSENIHGFDIEYEIVPFIDKGKRFESFLVYPFVLSKERSLIFFQFSNKKEKGLELLKWLLKKIKNEKEATA